MTRMEAIRNQYQQQTSCPPPPRGRAYPSRPRNRFWRWFWVLFLLSLLGAFFACKGTLMDWVRETLGEGKASPTMSATSGVGVAAPSSSAPVAAGGSAAAVNVKDAAFRAYVNPTLTEINQLCEYVRNSPNVRDNKMYAAIMKSVQFIYESNNDAVNAYASIRQLDKTKEERTRVIVYLAGAARFGRAAALAVAAEMSGDKGAAKRFLGALRPKDFSGFTDAVAARAIGEAGLAPALANENVVTKAKSVSAGMMLGIIAHEAGHQALGHLHNTSKTENMEVSRNQEREADSFSSSVIATSPFGEYVLVGTLFWHYAIAQQQGDDAVATSHPLSKERFENFVRANAELAASMGITLDK